MKAWRVLLQSLVAVVALSGLPAFADDARPGGRLPEARGHEEVRRELDASSDFVKQSVSRAEWTTQLTKGPRQRSATWRRASSRTRRPRRIRRVRRRATTLIQTYESVFTSQGAPKTETLPLVKSPDGQLGAPSGISSAERAFIPMNTTESNIPSSLHESPHPTPAVRVLSDAAYSASIARSPSFRPRARARR